MAYGDKLLKEAPDATIREAIERWKTIRENGRLHRQPEVVQTANHMLDKYEGELRRREEGEP